MERRNSATSSGGTGNQTPSPDLPGTTAMMQQCFPAMKNQRKFSDLHRDLYRLEEKGVLAELGSIFARVIRVGHRNPTIVVSISSHVAHAREVHVSESDQIAIVRRISKHPLPLNRGELLVNVKFNRDRWGIELHIWSVNCVAQENQLFTAVLERVKSLARRMSMGGNSANLGKQLGRPIKRSYLVRGHVRTHCLFDGLKEAF